jgi:hypothetical protein
MVLQAISAMLDRFRVVEQQRQVTCCKQLAIGCNLPGTRLTNLEHLTF